MSNSISKLQQLREMSVVVADTGDYEAIQRLKPVDCTTNPTLVRRALDLPIYASLVEKELAWARSQTGDKHSIVKETVDRLTVGMGVVLAGIVPGRVSTEVDADLAFNVEATVAKAQKFIEMYAERGISKDRILIKIAATWEGIQAAIQLQKQGIDCNLTLIFNLTQSIACAEAGVFLISPFVGRILDWHIANGDIPANIDADPGVIFVRDVYNTFKQRGFNTIVMAASFRSTGQIEALAGCDRLTISPDLLETLQVENGDLPRKLFELPVLPETHNLITHDKFIADMARDKMATEKLETGIEIFVRDLNGLRQSILERLK